MSRVITFSGGTRRGRHQVSSIPGERSGDRGAIPALIELLRFDLAVPAELPVGVLEALSGQRFGPAWPRWVEWLQKQTDSTPPPEFVAWKGRLLSLIDPAFLEWFTPGIARQPSIGCHEATCAALIPIRKTASWWNLAQDERRRIFKERSSNVKTVLKHLPAVARRLHHCRDLITERRCRLDQATRET